MKGELKDDSAGRIKLARLKGLQLAGIFIISAEPFLIRFCKIRKVNLLYKPTKYTATVIMCKKAVYFFYRKATHASKYLQATLHPPLLKKTT